MIDLHIHTKYSDGVDSVEEILRQAEQKKLKVISITDHDTCEAYNDLDECRSIFQGEIIKGCEFRTSFADYDIEILGYYIDPDRINVWKDKYYSPEKKLENAKNNLEKILSLFDQEGVTYSKDIRKTIDLKTDFIPIKIYKDIVQYQENYEKVNSEYLSTFSKFYRLALTKKDSPFFMDFGKQFPSIDEVVNLIHNCGGLAYLAHPHMYRILNLEAFLNQLYKEVPMDGIECYYSTFTDEQTNMLLAYAEANNLHISGGTDYHGIPVKPHEIGTGDGNLNIPRSILIDGEVLEKRRAYYMNNSYLIDIYDPKTMVKIGSKYRNLVHRDGDLHQTFHCYIVDAKKKEVLLQKRSKKKESFGGFYDISIAGHIASNSSVLETVHAKAEKELGLKFDEKMLNVVAIKRFYNKTMWNDEIYIDNEINSVYCLFVEDLDINTLSLDKNEVLEVKWFDLDELKEKQDNICIDLKTYEMVYNYVMETMNDKKSCPLCNQITNSFVAKANPYSKVGTNQLLKSNCIVENEDFVLLLDLLPIVKPIHLLVSPKKHIEGMANLKTKALFDSLTRFVEYNNEKVEAYYGFKPSYFEHGSISGEGNAGNSIFHFHYHLILVKEDYSLEVERILNIKPVVIKKYEELYGLFVKDGAKYKDLDYILYENMDGVKKVFPLDNMKLPSQFMRKIIYDANNALKTEQDWNWKKEVNIDLLNSSMIPLKDIYGVEVRYDGD